MPRITSAERLNEKLREIEQKLQGAIDAAAALSKIRRDAEELLSTADKNLERSKQAARDIAEILDNARTLQVQLEELHAERKRIHVEAQASRDALHQQVALAARNIDDTVIGAERRLADAVEEANSRTRDEITTTVAEIRTAHADVKSVEQSLSARYESVQEEFQALLSEFRTNTNSSIAQLKQEVVDDVNNFKSESTDEAKALRNELSQSLVDHQTQIDNNLTSFLSKQNVLIQNLTQQMDGFLRVANNNSELVLDMQKRFAQLETVCTERIANVKNLVGTVHAELEELSSRHEKLKTEIHELKTKKWWPFG